MSLDLTKPVQTREGNEVRLAVTDGGGSHPLKGYVKTPICWNSFQWTAKGEISRGAESRCDLVNVPEKVYWSKPEHIPFPCWVRMPCWSGTHLVTGVGNTGFEIYGTHYSFEDIGRKNLRWSVSPFEYKDGKECLVEEVES